MRAWISVGAVVVAVAAVVGVGAEAGVAARPYDPLEGNEGFLVFVEQDATLTDNESEGPVAVGGDLTIGGTYQVAFVATGGYVADGESLPSGLVVGGAVSWAGSARGRRIAVLGQANVNVGDPTGTYARDTDSNNAPRNTRVLPADDYDAYPRIELNVSQAPATVRWESPIDFAATFDAFRARSTEMAKCPGNVVRTIPGGGLVQRSIMAGTGQLNLDVEPGRTNVLNLTGAELNGFGTLNLTSAPTASSPLVINVDTSATGGVFDWTGFNFAGDFDQRYILVNFPDATAITLTPAAPTVEGTIYAPRAVLVDDSPSNVEGNIVARRYRQGASSGYGGGEVHDFPFAGRVSCGPTPTPTPSTSPSASASPSSSPSPSTPPDTGTPTASNVPSQRPGGPLPKAGAPIGDMLLVGGGLLAAGAAMLAWVARRRAYLP